MLVYLQMIGDERDRDRFARLYEKYRGLMFYVADAVLNNPMDAEDAVHEAFCAIAENIEKISSVSAHKTQVYIVTIVKRKAIDIYRRKQRHETVSFSDALENEAVLPPGEGQSAEVLARLPERYRELLVLKHFCGFSSKEIGNMLGMSDGMVRRRLAEARAALRSELEKEGIGR